jgi:L-asparaginase II
MTFTRSTRKALQALPFVEAGGPQHFGFKPEHIAMLCASHSGEPMHVQAAQDMLEKAGPRRACRGGARPSRTRW